MVRSLSEVAQRRFHRPKCPGIGGEANHNGVDFVSQFVFYTADS